MIMGEITDSRSISMIHIYRSDRGSLVVYTKCLNSAGNSNNRVHVYG